jgi:hypothetical protein
MGRQYKERGQSPKLVPVVNTETGRIVYVLPETLNDSPDKFQKAPNDQVGDPRYRGKPKPPRKPRLPERPEVPRDPPPAPVKPRTRAKPAKPTKPVKEVKEAPKMKVPEPSKPRRWKRVKPRRFEANLATVVSRYLRVT